MKSWILLLPLLSACSSAPAIQSADQNPAWIKRPESAFPADRYLVSVGNGSSRDLAIEDAKKSMAESFVVKVQSITESKTNSTFNEKEYSIKDVVNIISDRFNLPQQNKPNVNEFQF